MNRSQVSIVAAVLLAAAAVGWTWAEDNAKPVARCEADDAAIRKATDFYGARSDNAGERP
jgi:hypothetical protein